MLIKDEKSARKFIDAMSTAKLIAVDTETTNNVTDEKTSAGSLWDGRDYCMGISTAFQYNGEIWSCYFPFRHETSNLSIQVRDWLKQELESEQHILTYHNFKFDIASLWTIGIEPTGDFYDSLVMAHMCNEEFPSKELAWLSKFILKIDTHEKDRVAQWAKIYGWNSLPPEIMWERACFDATNTYKLTRLFHREMAA